MKFSLIFCTINRLKECETFFYFLENQTYKNFEIIIVDQNSHNKIKNIISKFPFVSRNSKYFKVNFKGLSRARNFGLKHVTGEIICFPDDDCWYSDINLLEKICTILNSNLDGISIPWRNENGELSGINWPSENVQIDKKNTFKTATSCGIFLKNMHDVRLINFNENLGAGSGTRYGSGEETDYLLQVLNLNKKILYIKHLFYSHPSPPKISKNLTKKMTSYSYGFGYVLRKHQFSFIIVLKYLIRPFLGIFIYLFIFNFLKANFYYNIFKGRFSGYFLKYKNKVKL